MAPNLRHHQQQHRIQDGHDKADPPDSLDNPVHMDDVIRQHCEHEQEGHYEERKQLMVPQPQQPCDGPDRKIIAREERRKHGRHPYRQKSRIEPLQNIAWKRGRLRQLQGRPQQKFRFFRAKDGNGGGHDAEVQPAGNPQAPKARLHRLLRPAHRRDDDRMHERSLQERSDGNDAGEHSGRFIAGQGEQIRLFGILQGECHDKDAREQDQRQVKLVNIHERRQVVAGRQGREQQHDDDRNLERRLPQNRRDDHLAEFPGRQ